MIFGDLAELSQGNQSFGHLWTINTIYHANKYKSWIFYMNIIKLIKKNTNVK
jgi:hypothetical protein